MWLGGFRITGNGRAAFGNTQAQVRTSTSWCPCCVRYPVRSKCLDNEQGWSACPLQVPTITLLCKEHLQPLVWTHAPCIFCPRTPGSLTAGLPCFGMCTYTYTWEWMLWYLCFYYVWHFSLCPRHSSQWKSPPGWSCGALPAVTAPSTIFPGYGSIAKVWSCLPLFLLTAMLGAPEEGGPEELSDTRVRAPALGCLPRLVSCCLSMSAGQASGQA